MSSEFGSVTEASPEAAMPAAGASPEQPSAEAFTPGETAQPQQQQLDDGSNDLDLDVIAAAAPQEINLDPGLVRSMAEHLKGVGLSEVQVAGIVREYISMQTGAYDTRADGWGKSREGGLKDLRSAWGTSFDSHVVDANFALTSAAGSAEAAVDLASIKLADGGVLGNHPAMIRMLANLGSRMQRPQTSGTAPNAQSGSFISAAGAQEQVDALMADEKFLAAYLHGDHRGHQAAVKRVADLHVAMAAG